MPVPNHSTHMWEKPCLPDGRGFLGWQHNVRGVALEELSLRAAIPTAERDGVALAFEYIQWLLAERQIGVRTEGLVIRSIMAAAKHVHHAKSQVQRFRDPETCNCTPVGLQDVCLPPLDRRNAAIQPAFLPAH